MDLVRDYLFLASKKKIKKQEYQKRMRLASDLLSSLHRSEEPIPKNNSEEDWYFEKSPHDQLWSDYLPLFIDYLAEYLDLNIKHYVCPGSGDHYRNWRISGEEEVIKIELLVENFEEEKKKILEYIQLNLLHPIKILFIEVKSLPNHRPRYH